MKTKTLAVDDRPHLIKPNGERTVPWLESLRDQDAIGEEAAEWRAANKTPQSVDSR